MSNASVNVTDQQEFSDADLRVLAKADQSKKLSFDASGLTTATTRTWTAPDKSGTVAMTSDTDVNSFTEKTTPVDADILFAQDSAASFANRKISFTNSWANYFKDKADALYSVLAHTHTFASLTSKPTTIAGYGITDASGFRNRLINGNGVINQRAAATNADDTYCVDRNYVLTQTGTIAVSVLSDVANGLPSMMRLTQSQASAQRMGLAQIIESVNCKDLRGQAVTLLGKLRCSSAQAIRFAILEWTGTADAVTSDVVNSWTNGTFTAGQFFNSTTLTVTQVGTITPSAAAVTDFLLTTTLGSSGNNVIVMIWTEGTAAQNVTLDVAWEFVKTDVTGRTYPMDVRSRQEEWVLCDRYFRNITAFLGASQSTTSEAAVWFAGTPLRTTSPTITWVSNFTGQPGGFSATGLGSSSLSSDRVSITMDVTSSGLTTFNAHRWAGGLVTVDNEL